MQPIRVILIGAFGGYMSIAMLNPLLAPLVRELQLTEIQAGAIASVAALAWALTSPFWGRRSDISGRKPVFVTGLIGFGVGFGIFAFIAQLGLTGVFSGMLLFLLLFVGRIIAGAFFSASPAAAQAYIADATSREERTGAMALFGAATGLGFVIGPALSGGLVVFGLLVPLYVAAIVPILAALLVIWQLPPAERKFNEAAPPRLSPFDSRIWPFALIGLVANGVLIISQVTAGFYIQDQLGFGAAQTTQTLGIALVAAGLTVVATQLGIVRRMGWSPRTLLRLGLPVAFAAYFVLLMATNVWMFVISFILLGLSIGLNEPGFTSAMTLVVTEREYGAVSGLTASVVGIAAVIAPLAGTGLYEIRPSFAYIFGLVLIAAMVVFVWVSPQMQTVALDKRETEAKVLG